MKHKKTLVFVFLTFVGYVGCFWDRYTSDYIFKKYCSEKVGVFVYERVGIGNEYFSFNSENSKRDDIDKRFLFDKDIILNRNKFEKDYIYKAYESLPISKIGPVNLIKSSVVRRDDGKLLSEAVSVVTKRGWLAQLYSFGYAYDQCPTKKRTSGSEENEHMRNHRHLLRKTFYRVER